MVRVRRGAVFNVFYRTVPHRTVSSRTVTHRATKKKIRTAPHRTTRYPKPTCAQNRTVVFCQRKKGVCCVIVRFSGTVLPRGLLKYFGQKARDRYTSASRATYGTRHLHLGKGFLSSLRLASARSYLLLAERFQIHLCVATQAGLHLFFASIVPIKGSRCAYKGLLFFSRKVLFHNSPASYWDITECTVL